MATRTPVSTEAWTVLVFLGLFEGLILLGSMGRGMAEGDDLVRDLPILGSGAVALATLGVACVAPLDDLQRIVVVLGGSVVAVALGLTLFG